MHVLKIPYKIQGLFQTLLAWIFFQVLVFRVGIDTPLIMHLSCSCLTPQNRDLDMSVHVTSASPSPSPGDGLPGAGTEDDRRSDGEQDKPGKQTFG